MASLGKKPIPSKKAALVEDDEAETPVVKKTFPAKKAGGAPAAKRAPQPKLLFKAPVDFKPAFFEVEFRVGKDGLIHPSKFDVQRVRGKWDNAENPRYNLADYDVVTYAMIAARLSSVTWAANVAKRLPALSSFGLVLRVAKRANDGSLATRIVATRQLVKVGEKSKWVWFDMAKPAHKADLNWRKLKKAARFLPSAFVNVQLPPSKRPKKAAEESED